MKRDRRLQGLSSDHHRALVLARTLAAAARSGVAGPAAGALGERFDRELEPHFRVEEELLLPALARAGEPDLVARTEKDHAFLRARAGAARLGDLRAMAAFAVRLEEHVRFEERELFPRCEESLPAVVLEEVARRAPKR